MMDQTQAQGESAISFRGVGKRFDDEWVIENIDFDVAPGTIIGLIGPSGCGKTTTVRLATGYYRPDAGDVSVLGTAPAQLSTGSRTAIGYLPQHPVLFDDLSLRDNLNFHASLNGVRFRRKDRLNQLMELVDLAGEGRKLVSESSGGMQRRLALAATLVHDPAVLMLDEPTAGIDPILRRRFWEHFRELRDGGTTLVVSTQFVGEAANCDVVAILAHGRVAAVGRPDELFRRAHGGDLFDVELRSDVSIETIRRLREANHIAAVHRIGDQSVRITTDLDAAAVGELCRSQMGEDEMTSLAAVPPDWDEVFIALVGGDDPSASSPAGDEVGVSGGVR